jgi:hypothetical protein
LEIACPPARPDRCTVPARGKLEGLADRPGKIGDLGLEI